MIEQASAIGREVESLRAQISAIQKGREQPCPRPRVDPAASKLAHVWPCRPGHSRGVGLRHGRPGTAIANGIGPVALAIARLWVKLAGERGHDSRAGAADEGGHQLDIALLEATRCVKGTPLRGILSVGAGQPTIGNRKRVGEREIGAIEVLIDRLVERFGCQRIGLSPMAGAKGRHAG